jgi:hypothetical protein
MSNSENTGSVIKVAALSIAGALGYALLLAGFI